MTLFVYAPDGKVPLPLAKLSVIGSASKPASKAVHLVTHEGDWGTTDFYCSLAGESASLLRRGARLNARLVYLPQMSKWLVNELNLRVRRKTDASIRLAAPSDYDTMLLLQPPPTYPLFGDLA